MCIAKTPRCLGWRCFSDSQLIGNTGSMKSAINNGYLRRNPDSHVPYALSSHHVFDTPWLPTLQLWCGQIKWEVRRHVEALAPWLAFEASSTASA